MSSWALGGSECIIVGGSSHVFAADCCATFCRVLLGAFSVFFSVVLAAILAAVSIALGAALIIS